MTAAFQPRTTGPADLSGRRFASCRRAPRRRNARPAKRVAGQKTASRNFFRVPLKPRRELLPQVTGTHLESRTYRYVFAPGCVVGPHRVPTVTIGSVQFVEFLTPSAADTTYINGVPLGTSNVATGDTTWNSLTPRQQAEARYDAGQSSTPSGDGALFRATTNSFATEHGYLQPGADAILWGTGAAVVLPAAGFAAVPTIGAVGSAGMQIANAAQTTASVVQFRLGIFLVAAAGPSAQEGNLVMRGFNTVTGSGARIVYASDRARETLTAAAKAAAAAAGGPKPPLP